MCQDRFAFVSQHIVGWTINLCFIVSSETKIGVESAHSLQIKQKSLKKYMQWIKSIRCDFYHGSFSGSCWERGTIKLYPLMLLFCWYSYVFPIPYVYFGVSFVAFRIVYNYILCENNFLKKNQNVNRKNVFRFLRNNYQNSCYQMIIIFLFRLEDILLIMPIFFHLITLWPLIN